MREPLQEFTLDINKNKNTFIDVHFLDFDGRLVKDELSVVPTMRGNMMVSKSDELRVGILETYHDKLLYYIKTQKHGSGPVVANPFEYGVDAAYLDTDTKSKSFQYTKVNKETFQLYIKFLKTRNSLYFTNLERIIKDGEGTF